MNTPNKKPRVYKRITPATVAQFKALEVIEGNGTAAVRRMEDTRIAPSARAFKIVKKSKETNSVDYIEDTMQQIGVDAINRVGKMVNSSDERIATKNAHFVIDHLRGKAVQRSESKHLNLTIETVLE
jgi:hypothetical protein